MRTSLFRIAALSFLFVPICLPALAQSVPPYRQTPLPVAPINWSSVNSELTQELRQAKIGALAQAELRSPAPTTSQNWLRRLALLVRADYPAETNQLLHSRPRFLSPDQSWNMSALVNESGSFDNLALAKRLCELFPEQTSAYGWFDKWARTVKPNVADVWLEEQGNTGDGRWFLERLKFRGKLGTENELLAPLEAKIRQHPSQLEPVEVYLRAVSATEKPQNTEWLAGVTKPKLAIENYTLGNTLKSQAAISFFERALKIPFTPKDAQWYANYARRMHFAYLGPNFALTEKLLHTWVKGNLLRLYQETKQTAKAQKLLEEIAAQQKNGISDNFPAFLAGQIQGSSGARVVEKRIKEAEPEQKNTPEYWLSRGAYFSGRKEDAQAIEAFEKALTLAPLPADGALTVRWQIVMEYARHLWLRSPETPTDAFRFVRKEFETAPPVSEYARGLMSLMLNYDQYNSVRFLMPDDVRVWDYLAAQTDWQVYGKELLDHLVRNSPPQRESTLSHAETMAADSSSAKRSLVLATVMQSVGEHSRAQKWIQDAIGRIPDKEERESTKDSLWQSYRFTNDWRGMERLLKERDTTRNPDYFAAPAFYDLAIAAADSKAKPEAWQYFMLWANQDRRSAPSQLYPLPSSGLLPELRAYYHKMAQEEPQSATPVRVLKMIGD